MSSGRAYCFNFPEATMMYAGMRIISDPNCLAETTERTFPRSRHRSARIRKKLIKRFGGEFRKEPAIFKIGPDTIIAHPVMYARIQAETRQALWSGRNPI